MILVSNFWAHVLFDTSASHSFIYALFVSILGLEFKTLDSMMSVGIPLGRDCKLSYGYSSISIEIGGRRFLSDLVVMPREQFEVILNMDCFHGIDQ